MTDLSREEFTYSITEGFHKKLWELVFDLIKQKGFQIIRKPKVQPK